MDRKTERNEESNKRHWRNARKQHENKIKEEVKRIEEKKVGWEDQQRRNNIHIIEVTDVENKKWNRANM